MDVKKFVMQAMMQTFDYGRTFFNESPKVSK